MVKRFLVPQLTHYKMDWGLRGGRCSQYARPACSMTAQVRRPILVSMRVEVGLGALPSPNFYIPSTVVLKLLYSLPI